MKTITIRAKCFLCDFEFIRKKEINEYGYFEIGEAYCPNDFSILDQIVDGVEKNHE